METSSSTTSKGFKDQDEPLVIVLHIEEGIGMNAAEAILLQASLSGNTLASEPIRPGHTTLFDCNLVWETDRKSIKRMKTENLPVKIDCYALRNFKGIVDSATKEHVGYILVPVKNIPLMGLSKAVQTKSRWMKFIGLSREWRQYKTELLMNLMITTKDFLTCDRSQLLDSHGIESSDSIVIVENPVPCMLTSQDGIFIRLLQDEGLIQVGNIDVNCDVFTVKIIMKSIRYLESMKYEDDSPQDLFVNYILLGNPHTIPLDKKFNRSHQIQEKVSINFRSSLDDLQKYFEKIFFIPFEIVSGDLVLGTTEIKLNQLIKTKNLQAFLEKYPSTVLEIDEVCSIKTANELQQNTNRPILEFKMAIKYVATRKLHQTECLEMHKKIQRILQDCDRKAGGDQPSVRSLKSKALSDIPEVRSDSGSSSNKIRAVGVAKATEPKHNMLIQKPSIMMSEKTDIKSNQDDGPISDLPRLFSYNLKLNFIKFYRRPEKGIWQLSFYHDKAETPRTIVNKDVNKLEAGDDTVVFEDIELKLYFTSQAVDILELVKSSDLCTLCVKGPRGAHLKAQLDCKSLLIGNKERVGGTILLKDKSEQVAAMANIFVRLEDKGINFNAQTNASTTDIQQSIYDEPRSAMNVTKTVSALDDSFAYNLIDELDEWKTKQQNSFMDGLQQKEAACMERLKRSWEEKRAIAEQEFVIKASKLESLTQSLQETQKSLKDKDKRYMRDDEEIHALKQQLEKSYKDQLSAIRERARRMEEDLLHEVKLKDVRFQDLEQCNVQLRVENCELRQQKDCLMAEFDDLKRNVVPKHEAEKMLQEMRLLKEKCELAQQSKSFYKEQWAKATRECHKQRRENLLSSKDDRFTSQCDRLSTLLDDNHSALSIDQQELQEIKHCLNLSDENDD